MHLQLFKLIGKTNLFWPIILLFFVAHVTISQAQNAASDPEILIYKTIGGTKLTASVFRPTENNADRARPAIILLHGGGWSTGSPEWIYDDAKRYAGLGMVAIAGEYRLSDQKTITPLEAMTDTRDLIRWVRQNAAKLAIDPHRIAVYGISAGGHLAAAAAVFPHEEESKISAVPDALILLSPPASIVGDHWPQMLLGTRAEVKDISPAENMTHRLPPMMIIEGSADSVTPLAGVQRFCEQAKRIGGICEIHVYPGLGHILSRNLDRQAQEEGPFDPDPAAVKNAHRQADAFLVRIGYIKVTQ
jgi:acetyl esterase/lipase